MQHAVLLTNDKNIVFVAGCCNFLQKYLCPLKSVCSLRAITNFNKLFLCSIQGAFWGLTIGLVVGLIRMVLDFVYPAPQCDQPDGRPGVVKYVHYLYLSMILALLTFIVVVVVSLYTEPPTKEMVRRYI